MKPVIIINFKTYPNSIGEKAVQLAKICEKVAVEEQADIRVAVAAPDIYPVDKAVWIPVYSEHIDPYVPGRHTGSVLPEMVKSVGGAGTLINHSEHRMPLQDIEIAVNNCKKLGLVSVVCANSPEEAETIAGFNPDFVAVEPPELIGGDVSVSTAHPDVISRSVEAVKNKHEVKLLVGAGVKTKEDVAKALKLGADGVLVASGIDKAENQENALRELIP